MKIAAFYFTGNAMDDNRIHKPLKIGLILEQEGDGWMRRMEFSPAILTKEMSYISTVLMAFIRFACLSLSSIFSPVSSTT